MAATVVLTLLALPATILTFAAPEVFQQLGVPVSYAAVTIGFALAVTAIVLAARDINRPSELSVLPHVRNESASRGQAAAIAGLVAAVLVALAAYRWVKLTAWYPYNADMLIVIREATRRFLMGRLPYATYRSYDAPWNMAMPYGPVLWGPFVGAQLLRFDFRLVTIAGELFVPAWCGIAATLSASRGHGRAAAGWLATMAALLYAIDVYRYTLIGHTPIYWPLLLPFAIMLGRRQWVAAGCLLALLVAARTTMVAIVPVFAIAAFTAGRRAAIQAFMALSLAMAVVVGPFVLWDWHAVWDSMVLSYPRVMKIAVWPELARPGLTTIGITEWALERHLDRFVIPVQIGMLIVIYSGAWIAIRRGRPAAPWMALALLAFSMTSLYPVYYLYYDVLLLLACAALADVLDASSVPRVGRPWALSVIAISLLPFAMLRATVPPWPSLVAGQNSGYTEFRRGFAPVEHDGARPFSWIVGTEAHIILPRSAADDADIVVTGESPFGSGESPQRMAASLNGVGLGDITIPPGRQEIHLPTRRSMWWIGFNDLELNFASTFVPRDAGGSEDSRPLALSLSRIDVVPRRR